MNNERDQNWMKIRELQAKRQANGGLHLPRKDGFFTVARSERGLTVMTKNIQVSGEPDGRLEGSNRFRALEFASGNSVLVIAFRLHARDARVVGTGHPMSLRGWVAELIGSVHCLEVHGAILRPSCWWCEQTAIL